jgi:protein-S-isoprenylcysteine O-methyltransferase Ste14
MLARWLIVNVVAGAVVLGVGQSNDPWLWAYVIVFAAISGLAVASIEADLARERFSPPSPGADRLSLRLVRLVALAHVLVAVLDSRFGWSHIPGWSRGLALAAFAASFLAILAAMRTNRFFSAVVRIQSERGHRVVDRGPYAFLRHPGYAAMIVGIPLSGVALGSWPAALVALVYSALIGRRVVFEDRFLQEHLEGYREYAARVRYRLLPGVW